MKITEEEIRRQLEARSAGKNPLGGERFVITRIDHTKKKEVPKPIDFSGIMKGYAP